MNDSKHLVLRGYAFHLGLISAVFSAVAACGGKGASGEASNLEPSGEDDTSNDDDAVRGRRPLRWFLTCGDPVCQDPNVVPPDTTVVPPDTTIAEDPNGSPPGGSGTDVPQCGDAKDGERCRPAGTICDPGLGCGVKLLCARRDPTVNGCPISRRKYKTDINYLNPADQKRMHDDLMGFRLATYRYKADSVSARRHLGFIIDDVGASPAVNANGETVDLYGFSTMAVAALQQQAKEIEALQREIASLKDVSSNRR